MTQYSDIYIVPQYSEVTSRTKVDTSRDLDPLNRNGNSKVKVPVISANMDTVTDGHMAKEIAKAGAVGAIHRFLNIQDNVTEYKKADGQLCLVSIGVNGDSRERAQELYKAGARYFVIDIAHGDHLLMKNTLHWMKSSFPNAFVVAGNVATAESTLHLIEWGADGVKVGIGPGAACTTKNVTGVTVPQFTAVRNCVRAARSVNKPVTIIADGGVKEIGDIAKAIGAGADFVMCGRLFAGCPEAPHPGLYRGMASLDAMKTIRVGDKLPTPEGKTMTVPNDMYVSEVVALIQGGLRSAFSYSNARNFDEFVKKCKFGFKHNVTNGIIQEND